MERTASYAIGDTIRISFSFQFTGQADLVEEILVVFSQVGSPGRIILRGPIYGNRITPDEIGDTITYAASVEGLVLEVEPGEYRCEEIAIVDEEGRRWPFTDMDNMDLVILIREQPAYELWVVASDFVLPEQ